MDGVKTEKGIVWNGHVAPALCLDLDGTIRFSRKDPRGFIGGPEDVALFDGVESKIWEYRDAGYLVFGISNQGGVAFGFKTHEQCLAELQATVNAFERDPFHDVRMCYHHDGDGAKFPFNKRSLLRKPNIGMLVLCEIDAFEQGYLVDWDNSLFVGDRPEDELCAKNAGIPFQWACEFFGQQVQQKDSPE